MAVLGTVSALAGAAGVGLHVRDQQASAAAARSAARTSASVQVQPSGDAQDASVRPASLSVPSIGVRSTLQALGLTAAGTLSTPSRPARAGWFSGGTVPGSVGPAVLVGHVDSREGPAVFARLSLLHAGDTIDVALTDGHSVRFQVTSVRTYPKDAFPTDAVYGAAPDPELRLITCGGSFTDNRYRDNVVVFARRIA